MKHNLRDNLGRFRSITPKNIVAGRLYGFRGLVVRAGADRQQSASPMRHVTCHKVLHGYVPENELRIVSKDEVKQYLDHAK